MQGDVTGQHPSSQPVRHRIKETELERRALKVETGAHVTGAVAVGDAVAATFGDGTVRFFRPELSPTSSHAHRGVVLCLAAGHDHILTGGDDGRFLRISPDGDVEELATFGTKWVDCVASNRELRACSSGRIVLVWSSGQKKAVELEHSSTVKKSRLFWQGSHGALTFSPDGKYIVTAMQENALHGWRLRGKVNLAMSGYPAKTKSFAWVGEEPYLVTSGADEAICWPFDGPQGPLNRSPLCLAKHHRFVTCVQALPSEQAIFAGFQDGTVLLSELDESKDAIVLRDSTGTEVTAIATTQSQSHLLIGDARGQILWTSLWAETPTA